MSGDNHILKDILDGGYILYTRHATTSTTTESPNPDLNDCSTQRNLSTEGQAEAKELGEIYRRLGITVSNPVLTSPYCRTRDTAKLAFGDRTEVFHDLIYIHLLAESQIPEPMKRSKDRLLQLFETVPNAGQNLVIIGHSHSFDPSYREIPFAGTVVLQPGGQHRGFTFKGLVELAQWRNEASSISNRLLEAIK